MKLTNTRGDWIGLAYWKGCSYRVDYFSSPDHWNLGFDVVYRLIFYTCDTRLIENFRIAFKKEFSSSDDHIYTSGMKFNASFYQQESRQGRDNK